MEKKEISYHFEGQRPEEDVVFVYRRHPWVLAKPGFITLAVIAILVIVIMFFGLSIYASVTIILAVLYFILHGFYQWYIFSNYLYILTNQRIIIIEQHGFWGRKIIEAELSKIQSVTTEVSGPIQTMLNFGDVIVKTAGMEATLTLYNIENPYKIQQKIIASANKFTNKILEL